MVERLGEAVRTELTTLEEVLTQRTELVAATRGARRQAEAVTQQLQGLAFWQGVPLSPLQVAEDVSFVEEYRWVTHVPALLWQRFLNLGDCALGGHWAMSGDTIGCHNWGSGCSWHLMGGGRGCCSTPYSAQMVPTARRIHPNVNGTH